MGQEAEDLMEHWNELFQAGAATEMPDAVSYTTLMKCWIDKHDCKSIHAANKAEEILGFMDRYEIEPTLRTYNVVLNAWSRASVDKSAKNKARAIWKRMKTHDKFSYMQPKVSCT
jgi:hypothetical protein